MTGIRCVRPSQKRRRAMRGSYNNRATVLQCPCDVVKQWYDFDIVLYPKSRTICAANVARQSYDVHTMSNIGRTCRNILNLLKIFHDGFTTCFLSYAAENRTMIVRLSHIFLDFSIILSCTCPTTMLRLILEWINLKTHSPIYCIKDNRETGRSDKSA